MDITATIPTLETERVVLRHHAAADFDAYAAMWADPRVTKFIGGKPRTREESWMRFLRHPGMWQMLGYGFWALEDKASGRFMGEAGFHDLKRDIVPSLEGMPEAGWALAPEFHGQGFATEVVKCFLAWGDDTFGQAKTVCIIAAGHAGSIRVAGKCGYRQVGSTVYHGDETLLFERSA